MNHIEQNNSPRATLHISQSLSTVCTNFPKKQKATLIETKPKHPAIRPGPAQARFGSHLLRPESAKNPKPLPAATKSSPPPFPTDFDPAKP